jgi:hypothetical protein
MKFEGRNPKGKISSIDAPFNIPLSGKNRKTVRFDGYKNGGNVYTNCENNADLYLAKCPIKTFEFVRRTRRLNYGMSILSVVLLRFPSAKKSYYKYITECSARWQARIQGQ